MVRANKTRTASVLNVQLNKLLYLFYILNSIGLSKVYPTLHNLRQRSLLDQTCIRPVDSQSLIGPITDTRSEQKVRSDRLARTA